MPSMTLDEYGLCHHCKHSARAHYSAGALDECDIFECDCRKYLSLGPITVVPASDPVNHPHHYESAYKGLEIIDLTEQMNFNRGNAVKYVARAGIKDPETEIQDLEKAHWYLAREIERLKKEKTG